jgi:hypothetical protein
MIYSILELSTNQVHKNANKIHGNIVTSFHFTAFRANIIMQFQCAIEEVK